MASGTQATTASQFKATSAAPAATTSPMGLTRAASGPSRVSTEPAARLRAPPSTRAALPKATMPAVHLASNGCCSIKPAIATDTSPNQLVSAFSSGAMAPAQAARVLVKVPEAASHRLARVPNCSLTRRLRSACAANLAATSS